MDAVQKLVETENIEFVVLVSRLQEINARLVKDTEHLKKVKIEEDAKMEDKKKDFDTLRDVNAKKRRELKNQKTEKKVEKQDVMKVE